ncbi:hypothetical protein EV05_1250 [Prochlorococcus sp. MIT 0601]|nr:hypothetical protein EV05_1250 [Prochlorococcus sp. MIT 0601]
MWFIFKLINLARKLSENQKTEIVKGALLGKAFIDLAKEYGCTPSTITRTVKLVLSDDQYAQLKRARSRGQLIKQDVSSFPEVLHQNSTNSSHENTENELTENDEFLEDSTWGNVSEDTNAPDLEEASTQDSFTEFVPLIPDLGWEEQKEVAVKPFKVDLLPETIYMLVDKKVELDSKPLKDFSQWSFLPEKDQNRLAILLFSNQRSAKRSCSRNQRVLKIQNRDVFRISCPFLVSKGITRLVIDDCLIALDLQEEGEPI